MPKETAAIGKALGVEKMTDPLARFAARATVPEGIREAIPEPTGKELLGSSLQVGSFFLPYGKISNALKTGIGKFGPEAVAKILGTSGAGAAGGFAFEAGEKLQAGETPTPGGLTAAGAALPLIPLVARKVLPKQPAQKLKAVIKQGIAKAIKPSTTSLGKSVPQREAYFNKAQDAVESILSHKQHLKFIDDSGNITQGALPENLEQFSEAIQQTKTNVFRIYDNIAKQAGAKGAKVQLRPITNELNGIIKSKPLQGVNPSTIEYAKLKSTALREVGEFTATEAQEAIASLNNGLEAFYRNPSFDNANKAYIDALIANKLRGALDDTIAKTTGKQYQLVKNKYGALKALEKDVNAKTNQVIRKIENAPDFSTIFSASTAVHGLLSLRPATIEAAGNMKELSKLRQIRSDPNKLIRNMFRDVEKIVVEKPPSIFRDLAKIRPPGDVAVDAAIKSAKLTPRLVNALSGFKVANQ